MPDKPRVFISYRNAELSIHVASQMMKELKRRGYDDIFYDKDGDRKIRGGDAWARTIYENIWESDVMVVLLEQSTALSDWVQREVDVARGAHISILPVKIVAADPDIREAQEKLALT